MRGAFDALTKPKNINSCQAQGLPGVLVPGPGKTKAAMISQQIVPCRLCGPFKTGRTSQKDPRRLLEVGQACLIRGIALGFRVWTRAFPLQVVLCVAGRSAQIARLLRQKQSVRLVLLQSVVQDSDAKGRSLINLYRPEFSRAILWQHFQTAGGFHREEEFQFAYILCFRFQSVAGLPWKTTSSAQRPQSGEGRSPPCPQPAQSTLQDGCQDQFGARIGLSC